MGDMSGLLWATITVVGVLVLGAALAYGGAQSLQRRRRTGEPFDPRHANAAQAAAAGGGRRSSGTYLMRLGLPVAAAFVLIAVVVALYT